MKETSGQCFVTRISTTYPFYFIKLNFRRKICYSTFPLSSEEKSSNTYSTVSFMMDAESSGFLDCGLKRQSLKTLFYNLNGILLYLIYLGQTPSQTNLFKKLYHLLLLLGVLWQNLMLREL